MDKFLPVHAQVLNGPYLVNCDESVRLADNDRTVHQNMYLTPVNRPSDCENELVINLFCDFNYLFLINFHLLMLDDLGRVSNLQILTEKQKYNTHI